MRKTLRASQIYLSSVLVFGWVLWIEFIQKRVIIFVFSLFETPKMAPVKEEYTWEKYSAFLDIFYPEN